MENSLSFHIEQACKLLQEELKQRITAAITQAFEEKFKNAATSNSGDKLLNIREVCELLGLSKSTIHKLKEEGLPFYKLGDSVRFSKQQVLAFIEHYKQEGAQDTK